MKSREIVIGEIYRHIHGLTYRIDSIGLDTTGYEKTGKVRRSVHYTQLDDGHYPAGTEWTKLEQDFLRRIRREGILVPIFEYVGGPK